METNANANATPSENLTADQLARKAKIHSIKVNGITIAKTAGLIGLGVLVKVGVDKFRNRNTNGNGQIASAP